jgi:hypothetical protein
MLTQLATVKARLGISVTDYDDLLTAAIKAISTRFDKETNRTLARSTGATEEFPADQAEVLVMVAIRPPLTTIGPMKPQAEFRVPQPLVGALPRLCLWAPPKNVQKQSCVSSRNRSPSQICWDSHSRNKNGPQITLSFGFVFAHMTLSYLYC